MTKIYKGKYGHQVLCSNTDQNGNKTSCYIPVSYKKDLAVPDGDYEGELVFKTSDGVEHSCFLTCYTNKDGQVLPKLVIFS